MATEIEIANQALSMVGADTITDFSDLQREAVLCKQLYSLARNHVLSAARWSFLSARTTLSPSVDSPAFGFRNAFEIPGDILEIYEVFDQDKYNPDLVENTLYWQREGDYILADADLIYVKYKSKKTDPSEFSDSFIQALSAYLAHQLSIPIAQNTGMSENYYALYERTMKDAANTDSLQGRTRKFRASKLVNVRRF